jgi:hypothetical protein
MLVTNLTLARPDASKRVLRNLVEPLAILVVAVALAYGTFLVDVPSRVDRVTVVNRSGVPVTVDVTSGHNDGVLLLGTVDAGVSQVNHDVFDQGATWVFKLSHAGTALAPITVSRATLAKHNWRFVIPPDAPDALSRTAQ